MAIDVKPGDVEVDTMTIAADHNVLSRMGA